ncbi:MAG: hypothetical protein EBS53_16810 [Bacteroidetes bacterium]|nr:hypothetical protein [Bacteroidota bacterium]
MDKLGKIWGFISKIFSNDNLSIDRIEIINNQKCSKHLHEYKYNMFFVENQYDTIIISPNIYHQFEALENSIVYEIYYTKLNDNDIIRDIK